MKRSVATKIGALCVGALVLAGGRAEAQNEQSPVNIVPGIARREAANLTIAYPSGPCAVKAASTNPLKVTVYEQSDSTGSDLTMASEWGGYKVVQNPANGFNALCGAQVIVGNEVYDLVQFHFHTPSEHTFNGTAAPVEVHFFHINHTNGCSAGDRPLLVIGAFMNPGNGKELDKLFQGNTLPVATSIDLSTLLPVQPSGYYHYDGSNAAPNTDCTWPEGGKVQQLVTGNFPEAVNWYVLSDVLHLSSGSIAKLRGLFPDGNVRAVKPLNSRTIYRGGR